MYANCKMTNSNVNPSAMTNGSHKRKIIIFSGM